MPKTPQQELAEQLKAAINDFDKKRSRIISDAFTTGGADKVNEVLTEYSALRDAAFEVNQAQLDANNADYAQVITDCKAAVEALKADIAALAGVAKILQSIASIVRLVGRALIVLGV
jgi:hypothetical protein